MKERILTLAAALYLFTGLVCATTFTVNSTDGGIVNTGTNSGSLGWCIANADQSTGPHTINVNVASITLTGTLPAITQRTTINGNGVSINANGYPGIAVNGNASGTVIDNIKFYGGAWGFDINGVSNITVKNSSIYRFAGNGIAVVANAGGITITGNEIYSNGTSGGGHGITIDASSHSNITITNNYIGCKRGSETYDSARGFNNKNYPTSLGNKNIGIEVYGADGLTITGNYSLNNGLQGIAVCGACSNFNISDNVVSYNGSHGIQLESITSGSGGKVNNNICGTNSGKTQDRGNEQSGIFSHQVTVAVSYSGNVCGCNKEMGMHLDGTQNATINGNFFGTNAKNGTTNLGNKMGNMWISWRDGESKNNTITNNTFAYGKQATNPSDAVISGGNSLNKSGSGFGIGIAGNANNLVNQIGKGNFTAMRDWESI